MMKILLMIPSLEIGGAQVFCADLCNELSKRDDVELHLAISFNIINEKFLYLLDNNKIHVHILNKRKGFSFSFLIRMYRLIKEIKPDVINTHTSFTLRYILIIPKMRHFKIFHTITNNPEQYNRKLFPLYKKRMHQKSWNNLSFIAISDLIADKLSIVYDYPRERIITIYNGIYPLKKPLKLISKFDFLNCGSLTDIKNQNLLIDAASFLKDYNIKIGIVGGGLNKDRYQDKINELKLEDNVSLIGKVSDPSAYYFESKFFILTSKTEGNPITILEALSAGLPIIAPAVGGIPDLVKDNENGFLFSPNIRADELADILKKCMQLKPEELLRIKTNNQMKIKKWYLPNIANQYLKLFKGESV